MAKRVAAQRRGLLYGMIAAIAVAAIMTGLFINSMLDLQKLYLAIDPAAKDMQTANASVEKIRRELRDKGVLPEGQSISLASALTALSDMSKEHRDAADRLAFTIKGKGLESVTGKRLKTEAENLDLAMKTLRETTALEALQKAPQAGIEGLPQPQAPTNLVAAIDELATHVKALNEAYKKKDDRVKSLEALNQTQEEKLKTLQTTLQANFDKARADADASLKQLSDKVKEVQAQADQIQNEYNAAADAHSKAVKDLKEQIQKLVNEKGLLNNEIKELVKRLARVEPREFEPDGRVIRLEPGQQTGYVNLGKGDGVFNGLTFSVLDPTELGKAVPNPKGHIRLTNVMAESSEFYIQDNLPTSPIVEGDIITNPAFDRQRPFHFTVVGVLDVNGDGSDDTGLVKDLIRRFGGTVDDKVSVETDYLVAGKDPLSAAPGGSALSKSVEAEGIRFGEANDLAMRLHIPVLTQNRFLSLVGFVGAR